jgi:outer membrane immunogenic protein
MASTQVLWCSAQKCADLHNGSTTVKEGGIDAKIGYPIGSFMPYARRGVTTDWPAAPFHYGVGAEYQFTKDVSMFAE